MIGCQETSQLTSGYIPRLNRLLIIQDHHVRTNTLESISHKYSMKNINIFLSSTRNRSLTTLHPRRTQVQIIFLFYFTKYTMKWRQLIDIEIHGSSLLSFLLSSLSSGSKMEYSLSFWNESLILFFLMYFTIIKTYQKLKVHFQSSSYILLVLGIMIFFWKNQWIQKFKRSWSWSKIRILFKVTIRNFIKKLRKL